MILINLLPYREQARLAKQKQFNQMMVLALIVGMGLSFLVYMTINSRIDEQQSRNQFMQQQLDELNLRIESVKSLQDERTRLLARKQKVEELQQERGRSAKLLDDLSNIMPEGVYLTELKSNKGNYTLVGKAVSDNRIAMFMNALPSTGVFAAPVILDEIKKGEGAQEFRLRANLQSGDEKEGASK